MFVWYDDPQGKWIIRNYRNWNIKELRILLPCLGQGNIDGLVQERRNSIANALELRLSFTNASMILGCFVLDASQED